MSTTTFAVLALGAAAAVALAVPLLTRRRGGATEETPPRLDRMEKLAAALTKGLGLLTAVLGIVAVHDGGLGRLLANAGSQMRWAIFLALGSVLLAFAAWMVVATAPERSVTLLWLGAATGSVALFATSVYATARAGSVADGKLAQPTLTVTNGAGGLNFTAALEGLTADESMRATVYGYVVGRPGARELLFDSTAGPDAQGRASLGGVVAQELGEYEVVEVRAFRGPDDPGCERPARDAFNPPGDHRAACAALWLVPNPNR